MRWLARSGRCASFGSPAQAFMQSDAARLHFVLQVVASAKENVAATTAKKRTKRTTGTLTPSGGRIRPHELRLEGVVLAVAA